MKKYAIILLAIAELVCAGSASAQAYMDKYARKFVLADPSAVPLTLSLTAPTLTNGAFTLTLPSALPLVAGSFLSSDLLGNLSWVNPSTISISHGTTLSGLGTSGSPLDVAVHGIQNTNLRQSVALSVIGNSTNATANVADISGTQDQVLRVDGTGSTLGFGQIATGGITDNAVTYAKMQAMTANMLLGSGATGTSVAEITLGPGLQYAGTTLNVVGASPTGGAGGDLAGNFPTPTIANTSTAGGDIIAALTAKGTSITNNTTGSAAKLTTPRLLAGNSFDGSADVPFANKFIVQGTTDAGLSGAQFLGALGTGIVKNTTTTGVLSIATPGTDYTLLSGLTNKGAVFATSANNITSTGAMADGQLLIGSTAGNPSLATLTAGTGISITNGSNSITLTATGAPPTGAASGDLAGNYPNPTIAATATAGNDAIAALNLGTSGTLNGSVLRLDATLKTTSLSISTNQLGIDLTHANTWAATQTFPNLSLTTAELANNAVTYAKMQAVSATSRLLGSSSTTTPVQEIQLGAGLTLAGTTLSATGSGGTVTSVSVATANGFGGSVATATTTPAITITTSVNGLLKGNGTAVSAATLGTDYSLLSGGVANTIPKWATASTLGNSSISDNGTTVSTNENITMSGAKTLTLGTAGPAGGTASLSFANSSNANLTTLQAGVATSAVTYKLPTQNGSGNQILSTDGNNPAQLSWVNAPNSSNSVTYLPATTQNTVQSPGNGLYLFDVGYASGATSFDAAGARITSTTTNTSAVHSATALTLAASTSAGSSGTADNTNGLVITSTAPSNGTATGAAITNTTSGSSGTANGLTLSNIAGAGTATGLSVTSTTTGTNANTGASITATSTGNNTTTGLLITTGNSGFPTAPVPQIRLASSQAADSSAIVTTALKEIYHEETGDLYGTSRMRIQNRTGSNGALFETIPTDGITNLVDFGFKPGTAIQSNIRLEARTGGTAGDYMRSDLNKGSGSNSKEEFQFYFGTTTANAINVFSVGEAATLLEQGNFGIGYNAATGSGNQAGSPLEKLDVHSTSVTQANILLSNNGTSSTNGSPGQLEFQGTRDGITSFIGGAQGSTDLTYILPTTAPSAGQVLTSAAGGASSQLSWSTVSGSSGVNYNTNAIQATASPRSNYLFNVAYNTGNATAGAAAGAVITSASTGLTNTAATGLSLTTTATGTGTAKGLILTTTSSTGTVIDISSAPDGSGFNGAGSDLVVSSAASTGTAQSNIIFKTPAPGGSGFTTRTPTETMRISGTSMDLSPWGTSSGNTTELHFKELAASGSNYVGFNAPDAITNNVIWTLPNADGNSGDALTTDGAGNLSWATASSTGVNYNPTAIQNTATVVGSTHYLFNVAYAASNTTNNALGAVISSVAGTSNNTNATGLALTTTAHGTGTAKGLVLTTTSGTGSIADIISAPDGGGSNSAGSDLVISSAASTGNAQSNIIFKTPAPGGSGSTTRTPTETMRISGTSMELSPWGTSSGNTSELHFKELLANGSSYVGFKAPNSITSSQIWTLPNADGNSGDALTTDGTGNLSWTAASGGLSGLNTNGVVYATSSSAVSSTAVGTAGQVLQSNGSGNAPSWGSMPMLITGNCISPLTNPNSGTTYLTPMGQSTSTATDGIGWRTVVPRSGTVSNFYIMLSQSPGINNTRVFTIRKNGSDQTVTVSIGGNSTTGNDTSHSFLVSAGDELIIKVVSSRAGGQLPNNTNSQWGFELDTP